MNPERIVIVGGGAAGFFAALTCAEARPDAEIIILEKTAHFLSKVKISGGGRCNVTHACFDARELTTRYPRGERALIAPFKQFQAADTVAWFEQRGVKLKTEADGRMFPTTDSSQTIIDCLLNAAHAAGVKLKTNCGVESVVKNPDGRFAVKLERRAPSRPDSGVTPLRAETVLGVPIESEMLSCDKLLLATGGCRTPALGQLAVSLGHTLAAPVPSLFTFHVEIPWLRELAGVSLEAVEASVPGTNLRERGALLLTHWGVSGPAILRLSAWGARELHEKNYQFALHINWLPHLNEEQLVVEFQQQRKVQPAKFIVNTPLAKIPSRLWEQLVIASGIARDTRWAALSGAGQHKLLQQLLRSEFPVTGKSLNKDEFVTCGGVRLNEINFKTMESKLCPGLFFAGEVLDIDGITGGFNFQAAWTTGWLAGRALAEP
ncbi:MAG TPA: NAD(P)/FAD-dependent oxidoreductase [Verrucomicrobiae bacterium]|nr:NAD(P)/FAD-dependent oxidoreductase [Verrucomicrobiae bacterium]